MATIGEVVAQWREQQRPKLSRYALAKMVGTSRQNIDNLENGVAGKPRDYLPALAKLMGYASSDDLQAGLPPPPSGAVAHSMSLPASTVLQTVTWEKVVSGGALPEVFILALPDDALAPVARAGELVIWSTAKAPTLGAPILVRDRDGNNYVRRMHEGKRPGQYKAAPKNDAFRTLDSEEDGLTIVAVWAGKMGDYVEP